MDPPNIKRNGVPFATHQDELLFKAVLEILAEGSQTRDDAEARIRALITEHFKPVSKEGCR